MSDIAYGGEGEESGRASDVDEVFKVALRIKGSGAVSREGDSRVAWSVVRKDVPSGGASLGHILIEGSSEGCGFFRSREMFPADQLRWGCSLWSVFFWRFLESLGVYGHQGGCW